MGIRVPGLTGDTPADAHDRAREQLPLQRAVRRAVIIEADDLGLVYAFNEGIRSAFREGLLTSTCLRTNGYAYRHAIEEVLPACHGMHVGIHLCLNEGEPVTPAERIPLLLRNASFRTGYVWLMRLARRADGLGQIERELRGQIERALADGVEIDHLNSHQHVHMIPAIFRLTCRLAREYGVRCVRLARELPYGAGGLRKKVQPFTNSNFVKHLLLNSFARVNEIAARQFGIVTTDYFVGINYTAHMSLAAVLDGLRAAPYGSVELLLHPAIGPDPRDERYPTENLRRYVTAPQRRMELHSLRSPELSEFLRNENWIMTTYAEMAEQQHARQPRRTTPAVPEDVRRACESVELRCPPWVSAAQDDSRVFAQLVATQAQPGDRVLDVGAGTGIIAICLAKLGRHVQAVDISSAAVRTAKANARRNGITFDCRTSDLLERVEGRFDLIAFNPPYSFGPDNVATNVAKHVARKVPWVRRGSGLAMPRPVLRFHQQLIERLVRQAPAHLTPNGRLLLHAYLSEVSALAAVLPENAEVELLEHPALTRANQTVGMLIRLPA